jgi:hypothetical protein
MFDMIKKSWKMSKKAQVGGALAFALFIIVLLGVTVPVASQMVTNASLSGIDALISGFIVTFLVIGGLVGAAAVSGLGRR